MRVSFRPGLAAFVAGLLIVANLAAQAAPAGAPSPTAATAAPAPTPGSPPEALPAEPPVAPPSGPTRTRVLTLNEMGVYGPLPLRGPDPNGAMSVDVRTDEVVTAARLKLDYAYSPALIFPLSHLRVLLNGELITTLPLDKDGAGKQVSRTIDLDPRLFVDYNRITVQMIAHYTTDQCEDPYHSSLWTDISPTTSLALTTASVALPDSLALLPAPFFDRHDNRLLNLAFVLPQSSQPQTLRAAGIVASWFGSLADYRHARFTAATALPADSHAVVLAMPGATPPGVTLPEIKGPTVAVIDNPAAPPQSGRKLLVVAGRDQKELETAAEALVLGRAGMAGNLATIKSVDLGPRRRPYDAPNWAPVDRPIQFRELVTDPQQLQVSGYSPPLIRVNLRVPPDLYAWAHQSVPLDVHYRYTAPSTYNDSILNVSINDQLVRSERLRPQRASSDRFRLNVPLLSSIEANSVDQVGVPVFRVAANNQFQFLFHMDSQKTGLCASSATDVARASVDPDSSIDFSGFAHYTALPNLSYFATSGYPFSRMADLSDTAVVMPDAPNPQDLATMLTLLGRIGEWTGLPALRVDVVPAAKVAAAGGRDLLVIGTGSAGDLLAKWGKSLPMLIGHGGTELSLRDQRNGGAWTGLLADSRDNPTTPLGRASIAPSGPLAALIGFESPLESGRSVVAVVATSSAQLGGVLDALQDDSRVSQVRGDLAVFRDRQIDSLRVGDLYLVGDLPWYARFWVFISHYPALLAIAGILAGLVVALTVFWALSRLAVRRTGN
ncbi:cellulose biosynthesis cyclic di-GMP-binding regulatory protein BcsB [Paraburkholderia caballeronis]|uniref:Cyclic di-GMP-binding protein n=1 Tax=Paraburkholderia caballeronis TaxID=416943 RepID=A0A1H7LEH8_9BURK|nr:cellulose biosynthesis cyclic di-GMP-binding regulatory protein BcsB [Paraburkholderia caballeronis]PXW28424.1 cellulose synthase subunit [Paraburkholderia caballeronis]PXX03790.1 cellulose synthase subunit [Paraburkholderia caballeronis]RAK04534.1 cellulose synthase subunit [Paraburkholderia caballeronis]SED76129.1 cellulose synthase subunit [Paraburkholderia caballeronis]SEK97230.1 cellulose synthase subunit [Paraburkholderia caballeronis]